MEDKTNGFCQFNDTNYDLSLVQIQNKSRKKKKKASIDNKI